jgi:hypothetical protein
MVLVAERVINVHETLSLHKGLYFIHYYVLVFALLTSDSYHVSVLENYFFEEYFSTLLKDVLVFLCKVPGEYRYV